jgi:cytoskeletal protein RodZ
VKTPKPFLPVRKSKVADAGGAAPKGSSPIKPQGKSETRANSLIVGGEPRVKLLPREVVERKKAKALKRRLLVAVLGVIVIVAAGIAIATVSMTSANASLLAAHAQTASLLQQQAKYSEVTKIKSDAASIQASQKLATAQEISWQPYIASIEATLPAGSSITSITAGIDSPFTATTAPPVPLQGPRIATVSLTVSMPQGSIAGWLQSLPSLKGYVDATPDSVSLTVAGTYVVAATIHVNSDALANRFVKVEGASK